MPKGSDTQEKIKQIISRIKDVYPNMKDDAAFDYIYRTKQHMKQQGRKAKFPADAISFIMQEGNNSFEYYLGCWIILCSFNVFI